MIDVIHTTVGTRLMVDVPDGTLVIIVTKQHKPIQMVFLEFLKKATVRLGMSDIYEYINTVIEHIEGYKKADNAIDHKPKGDKP